MLITGWRIDDGTSCRESTVRRICPNLRADRSSDEGQVRRLDDGKDGRRSVRRDFRSRHVPRPANHRTVEGQVSRR